MNDEKPKTRYIKISDLQLLDKNPRQISKERFEKLKESIRKNPDYFFARPCLVNDKSGKLVVYAGNQRMRAADAIGLTEIPCIVETLTIAKQRERTIRDNVEFGEWDMDLLANDFDLDELKEWGVDVLKLPDVDPDQDNVPETPEDPISKMGDVYQLGDHRVMVGDVLNLKDVEALMNGQSADMVFVDPPYNVDYEGGTKDKLKIKNDKMSDEDFEDFLYDSFLAMINASKKGAPAYVCHGDLSGHIFRKAFLEAGFELKQCIIWNKNVFVIGRQDYHWKHEPILYGYKGGAKHKWYGGRNKTTVWDVDKPSASKLHPTMKPVELVEKALLNSSQEGDIIIDFFGGSGSTLIACEKMKRRCFLLELDPKYVDVVIKRYIEFTNKDVTRLSDGKKWSEISV